jgi:hypothetical protein
MSTGGKVSKQAITGEKVKEELVIMSTGETVLASRTYLDIH